METTESEYSVALVETNPHLSVFAGRTLKSVEEAAFKLRTSGSELVMKQDDSIVEAVTPSPSLVIPEPLKVQNSKKHSRQESSVVPTEKTQSHRKKVKIATEDDGTTAKSLVPFKPGHGNSKSSSLVPLLGNSNLKDNIPSQIMKIGGHASQLAGRDNTSYVYCPEAQHFSSRMQPDQGGNIALLIPSSLLNSTTGQLDTSLLEVSCQVLSYYVWPMPSSPSNVNPN
jgi:hypothetical protein